MNDDDTRVGVDARVELETVGTDIHHMFVDRVGPVRGALTEAAYFSKRFNTSATPFTSYAWQHEHMPVSGQQARVRKCF